MNDSNLAAKQILEYLIKNDWGSTNPFDTVKVKNEIAKIIDNTRLTNITLLNTNTCDSATTYTVTL